MSHQISIIYTRPNLETPFYRHTSEYITWFQTNYIDTGKFVRSEASTSADGLTETWSGEWTDDAARNEWLASGQAVAANTRRSAYASENNITITANITDHD